MVLKSEPMLTMRAIREMVNQISKRFQLTRKEKNTLRRFLVNENKEFAA